jgi:tripartite-type tricarboxylate transporter receptor subunit TctC
VPNQHLAVPLQHQWASQAEQNLRRCAAAQRFPETLMTLHRLPPSTPSTPSRRVAPVTRRHFISLSALALGGSSALAQGVHYPSKPVTLVVGYPPGGSTDLTARLVGAELAKQLGQTVIIDNVGGAGGALGAQKVLNAPADGHTLLLGANNEMAIAGLVNPALRYDPVRQFTPIGLVASQPMVLVASNRSGVKDIQQFVEQVKRSPGRFSYGSSGVGTALNLAGEMVKKSAGLFIVHIPYRGVAPLTSDLVGGQLEFGVFVLSSGLPHIRSGKVVALGTTEARRSAVTPDIPALSEHPALRDVDIASWFGLWGPAGLPPAVTQRLQAALAEALATPELRKRLAEAGASMAPAGKALGPFQMSEIEKYRRIVDFAKIRE